MNNNIYLKISEIRSLQRRLSENIQPISDLEARFQECAELHFAWNASTDSVLVIDAAVVSLKFDCFNTGSEIAIVEEFVFTLDNGEEIPYISDHIFPFALNWKEGIQTITTTLLRPPLELGRYQGKAALKSNLKNNPDPLRFEIILKKPEASSHVLTLFPKQMEISAETMIRIMKKDTPLIGTAVLFNPTRAKSQFAVKSDSNNLVITPINGMIDPCKSLYINIAVSGSHSILPGAVDSITVIQKTIHGIIEDVIHFIF